MRKLFDPYAQFVTEKLSSGLEVHYLKKDVPWISLIFCIHTGASNDPVGKEGMAHFVEHLIAENIPSSCGYTRHALEEIAERDGGIITFGETSYFSTSFRLKLPLTGSLIFDIVSVLGAMLLEESFCFGIEEQRRIITHEFLESFGNEVAVEVTNCWLSNLFQSHWRERSLSILGCRETIEAATQKDLQSFYDRHYAPKNISIIGIGGLPVSHLLSLLEKSVFGQQRCGKRNPLRSPLALPLPPRQNWHVREASKYSNVKTDKGFYASRLLLPGTLPEQTVILLRNMIREKLFRVLREKWGWVYGIDVNWKHLQDVYEFGIEAHVSLESLHGWKIHSVINESILEILDQSFFEYHQRKQIGGIYLADSALGSILQAAMEDIAERQRIMTRHDSVRDLEEVSLFDIESALKFFEPDRRVTMLFVP